MLQDLYLLLLNENINNLFQWSDVQWKWSLLHKNQNVALLYTLWNTHEEYRPSHFPQYLVGVEIYFKSVYLKIDKATAFEWLFLNFIHIFV